MLHYDFGDVSESAVRDLSRNKRTGYVDGTLTRVKYQAKALPGTLLS